MFNPSRSLFQAILEVAEFDAKKRCTVLGRVDLENRLADLLGVKVDLAHAPMLRDGIRQRATREAVLVF